MNQRWFFIIANHQRGTNRFFMMWKLSRERQTEGVVMEDYLAALSVSRDKIRSARQFKIYLCLSSFYEDHISEGHFDQNERHILLEQLCWQIIKMNY